MRKINTCSSYISKLATFIKKFYLTQNYLYEQFFKSDIVKKLIV